MEKRRQAAEETKASRQKALDASSAQENEDTSVLDNLLEKLRNGDTVGRRARRGKPGVESRPPIPLTLAIDGAAAGDATADIARDMLARLKSDGFEAFTPASPTLPAAQRRRRRRAETVTVNGNAGTPEGPRSPDIMSEGSQDTLSRSNSHAPEIEASTTGS